MPNYSAIKRLLALGINKLVVVSTVWLLCGLSASANNNLLGGPDPLPPEVAFEFSIDSVSTQAVTVAVDIKDGYYLYRDKTQFAETAASNTAAQMGASESGATRIFGPAIYPEATLLDDEFFGEMAIFRGPIVIDLPIASWPQAQNQLLGITFQGCADIGLCYPPTTVSFPFTLAESDSKNADPSALSNLPKSDNLASSLASPVTSTPSERLFSLGPAQDELLPPELAYLPQIVEANSNKIAVRWHIEPGYYLYRDKLSFQFKPLSLATLTSVVLDPGIEQHDEFFGDVKVFRTTANALLHLSPQSRSPNLNNGTLLINYQGCADIGVCFPPSTVELPLSISAGLATQNTTSSTSNLVATTSTSQVTAVAPPTTENAQQSEQDRLYSMLGKESLWLNVATFFGLGLLLAFTPCVLPMIPILSSLIVGQGGAISTGRAFQLSLVYVLVMATTYAVIGIVVGLSGYNVQAFLQNPWVLSGIAVLFVLLSLSMFGFYELQMPTSVQERLMRWSNNQSGGQVTGVALMGFISTLIVGPCVTAPLAGALIYIAKTGDAVIGGAALFALGLGMGAPLLLIGTSAGKLVPKAGAWMNATKHIFGIIMLAMAIYMLSRILPANITMALFATLAIMSGIHLGAMDMLTRDSSGWQRFHKGVGVVIAIYGVALMIGSLSGANSYLTPLRSLASNGSNSSAQNEHGLAFTPVKGLDGLQAAILEASAQNRAVMLDFYADWCISCKEMEAFTFTDQRVQAQLENAMVIQADVTANDEADQALLKHFDLFGPPGIIFYDQNGVELPAARVVGFMNADKFSQHLAKFL